MVLRMWHAQLNGITLLRAVLHGANPVIHDLHIVNI